MITTTTNTDCTLIKNIYKKQITNRLQKITFYFVTAYFTRGESLQNFMFHVALCQY